MSLLDALKQILDENDRRNPPQGPRFENGRYRDCKWCGGRGCVSCKIECDKEYARQFPDGPVPIATFDLTKPDEVEKAKSIIGREAIEKAFGVGGGGVQEIIDNLSNYESTRSIEGESCPRQ